MRLRLGSANFRPRIAELLAKLGKSPHSSKPPSEGLAKPPPKPSSLRKRSGKKAGGQPGSPGNHVPLRKDPNRVIVHEPMTCDGCGGDLADAEITGFERCQVLDLPPPVGLITTEHRAEHRRCNYGHELRFVPRGGQCPDPIRSH